MASNFSERKEPVPEFVYDAFFDRGDYAYDRPIDSWAPLRLKPHDRDTPKESLCWPIDFLLQFNGEGKTSMPMPNVVAVALGCDSDRLELQLVSLETLRTNCDYTFVVPGGRSEDPVFVEQEWGLRLKSRFEVTGRMVEQAGPGAKGLQNWA